MRRIRENMNETPSMWGGEDNFGVKVSADVIFSRNSNLSVHTELVDILSDIKREYFYEDLSKDFWEKLEEAKSILKLNKEN